MMNLGKLPSVPIERRPTPRPVSGAARKPPYFGIGEPPLAELLSDPILHRMMASDSVTTDELSAVIASARLRVTES